MLVALLPARVRVIRFWAAAAAGILILSVGSATVSSARASLFDSLAGIWSGAGTVTVSGGNPERLRCRADYAPSGGTQLRIGLRCASDSFNLQVSSDISRQGDRIVGRWSEASSGVTGDVSGTVGATQMQANVSGVGISGRLTLVVRGDVQNVTLSAEGPVSANASVVLNRS